MAASDDLDPLAAVRTDRGLQPLCLPFSGPVQRDSDPDKRGQDHTVMTTLPFLCPRST